MDSAEVLIKFKGDTENVDEAQKKVENNFKELQKKGEVAFTGLTAAADAFALSILKGGVQYNAEIETYLTRLTTLTGSAEKAEKVLEQIKKDALSTPFEVKSLTQAESLLLSTGMSAEDARSNILALGDAISASGGGNEELMRMAVNLQQIKNVGQATALDIKQFAYAGVDIYGLLADSMGKSKAEVKDMKITYDMLSTALQKASQKGGRYYQAMEKQSKTYAGAMSNLKEAVEVFKGEISKGLFNALKKIIPKLNSFFNWLTKNKDIIIAIAKPTLIFLNIVAGFIIFQKAQSWVSGLFTMLKAHPYAIAIAGIVALTTVIIDLIHTKDSLDKKHDKEIEKIKKQKTEIDNQVKSWKDLKEAQQQNIDTGMTELSHEQALYSELKNITDANGKVKKGYEERAKFITTELSNSLGVEIKMTDGVIQNYKNIQKEIEKTMKKKQAQIQLEAQEDLYKEAIKKQTKAQRDLLEMKNKIIDKNAEIEELEKSYAKNQDYRTLKKLGYAKNEMKAMIKNYNKQEDLIEEYYYNIGQYQSNYEKFQKGQYDKMTYNDWEYVKKYKNASDGKKQQLKDEILTEEAHLKKLEQMKKKSGSNEYDQQIKDAQAKIKAKKEEMKQYEITTETGLNNVDRKWADNLSKTLSKMSNRKIEFKNAGNGMVQAYVDGVKVGEPVVESEMYTLGNNLIKKLNKKGDAKTTGKDIVEGLANGIKDQKTQTKVINSAKDLSNSIIRAMRTALGIKSPSRITKQIGVYLLEGLDNGIISQEDTILKNTANFTKQLLNTLGFDKTVNGNINSNLSSTISSNFNPYTNMNSSMLGAMNNSRGNQVINVYASFKQDNLGQMVRDIKTFSGGARNDFNYGSGI